MRIAIMQPYYFPYISYYDLINLSDVFVIYDDVQYIKQGWVNRNRIRCQRAAAGWRYITIPVSVASHSDRICEVRTGGPGDWALRHVGSIRDCYGGRAAMHPLCRAIAGSGTAAGEPLADVLDRLLRATC